ncbi:hypothetical protein F5I97DRAFT_1562730 [Phlebopus sp. FC_14]|nr:hypothetical protein F5I97DRAFT_1562730 [Phlebopus sp. FC_14]
MADSTVVASDSTFVSAATGLTEKLPIATPPPKSDSVLSTSLQARPQLPPIPTMPSLGVDIPQGPMAPVSPTGPPDSSASLPSPVEKTRKFSHLVDLIESEKSYVDLLTGVIRKVAAAWSRSNLPPPELDVMFRSVEAVYKANRMLLAKLKEIGENPSSPKALGDLLMRWIDDLDRPYTTYADKYCTGFDDWKPVKSNHKLNGILEAFSVANPLPSSIVLASQVSTSAVWTLDALFSLPKGRLHYYRKLYSRLLRSTAPGRSDHRLLTGALEKLDDLLATIESRAYIRVGEEALPSPPLPPPPPEEIRNAETDATGPSADGFVKNNVLLSGQFGAGSESASTSLRGSSSSSGERYSRETESTSISRDSSQINPPSVVDLERRLATNKTLDIFTMEPKQVRLQMAPPTLPYAREIRASVKVVIRFTPKSTGAEVVHHHGHIYILSDLFLVCEEIRPEERDAGSDGGPDMRLCYPPLSGKVLKVFEVPGQVTAVQVSIMRKETLTLVADSQQARDDIIKEFHECISFAKTMSAATQEPVPPLPKIGLPNSPAANLKPSDRRELPERPMQSASDANTELPDGLQSSFNSSGSFSPTVQSSSFDLPRVFSPQNGSIERQQNQHGSRKGSRSSVQGTPSSGPTSAGDQTAHGVEGAARQLQSLYPPRKSSVGQGATNTLLSSFTPGQIIPPVRSTSMQSPLHMRSSDRGFSDIYSPPAGQQPPLQHRPSIHSLRQQSSSPLSSLDHKPSIHHNLPPQHVYSQQAPATYHGPLFHSGAGTQIPQHMSRGSALPAGMPPVRPPSEPSWSAGRLQKSLSSRSLHSQYEYGPPPPVPSLLGGLPQRVYGQHKDPSQPLSRPILPSMQMGSRANSYADISILDPSPPTSPVEETKPVGPVRSTISAQMKCKVFHQQQHAQWKSLGSAKLTLYRQEPTNVKQLVVEADTKDKAILISTIVLTDGVERVGKTGVAIELSDAKGARTGIIYMIQLRNETSAGGLFETLLAGSDRSSK